MRVQPCCQDSSAHAADRGPLRSRTHVCHIGHRYWQCAKISGRKQTPIDRPEDPHEYRVFWLSAVFCTLPNLGRRYLPRRPALWPRREEDELPTERM